VVAFVAAGASKVLCCLLIAAFLLGRQLQMLVSTFA
jgi:hypothetical protein